MDPSPTAGRGAGRRLILASSSPRRSELLAAAGYEFDIVAADIDETPFEYERPEAYVERLAAAKAAAVAAQHPDAVVVGADTIVVLGNELIGKPRDEADAMAILRRLSGAAHHVLTGIAVASPTLNTALSVESAVWFRELDDDEIDAYVATGEPLDKAGAYAIQGGGADFVSEIEGAWDNVVGLPVSWLEGLLLPAGVTPR